MTNIIEARDLRDKDRLYLWEHVPLSTPWVIFLEPTNLCNCHCKFCPTGYSEYAAMRPNGVMSLDVFHKVLRGLEKFPQPLRRLNLYKDGEPTVNPIFGQMVYELRQAGVAEQTWVATNGLMLKYKRVMDMLFQGLDVIRLSIVHPSAEGYLKYGGVKIDYPSFVQNVAALYRNKPEWTHLYISLRDTGLTEDDKRRYYADFGPISDSIAIEGLHGWSNSDMFDFRLGTDNSFDGNPLIPKIACPLSICALGINWNGTVGLCNEDWRHKTIVGDVNKEKLTDIWHGSRLHQMRMMHVEGRRSENEMCATCQYMTCLPDFIDEHLGEIKRKLIDGLSNRNNQ